MDLIQKKWELLDFVNKHHPLRVFPEPIFDFLAKKGRVPAISDISFYFKEVNGEMGYSGRQDGLDQRCLSSLPGPKKKKTVPSDGKRDNTFKHSHLPYRLILHGNFNLLSPNIQEKFLVMKMVIVSP